MKKMISLCIIGILVTASLFGFIMLKSNIASAGTTWYVGSGLGNDSTTITGGISLASNGDTVFVYAGIYAENVVVDRSINLTGEDRDSTIIDGGGGNGIHVISDYVNITGFTITNSDYALYLQPSSNSTITNNNLSGNNYGLHIRESSADNRVSNNIVSGNSINGIYLSKVYNSIIENNIISYNGAYGFYLLAQSFNITISENLIFENSRGINLITSANCTISSNNISRNDYGIWVSNAVNSTITMNNFISNINFGITFTSSAINNRVYHNNFFNNNNSNSPQANDDSSNQNQWDLGYPSGGNYWSDYSGIDLNTTAMQNVPPSDGIGDTPYVIDSDSQDNYPKMSGIGNYIYLYPGWNLISIPLIQSNTNLDSVLSSIKGSYDAVQWYNSSDGFDPWKHNHSAKTPLLNDLDKINHLMGFWVHIIEPNGILFEYFGNKSSVNQTITLHTGWNLVGYPSNSTRDRTDALNNLTFQTEVDAIWSYDAAKQRWEQIGEFDYFRIGKGYWIHAKTQCEWEVPL